MEDVGNVENVKFKLEFSKLFIEMEELNDSLMALLSPENAERQTDEWYENKFANCYRFANEVKKKK